jgi:ubiquitin-like modifier-activating enzyme ATG7
MINLILTKGLAFLAAGMAVELMVAILHSPMGNRHTAESFLNSTNDSEDENHSEFIPHQIRGFLGSFSSILPSTPRFSFCTACSHPIINAYIAGGDVSMRNRFISKVILHVNFKVLRILFYVIVGLFT